MNFKKLLSIILVCCMLMAVLSFTACGNKDNDNDKTNENDGTGDNNQGENNGNKTYTLTVFDKENNPIEGVKLVITDEKSYKTVVTGADGRASTELPDTKVSVMITSVPSGYEKPEKISGVYHAVIPEGMLGITFFLDKEASNTVNYTVKVVDQFGNAVEGMQIQLCPDGVCLADQFITDANGEISKEMTPKNSIDVKLYDLDGYTLPIVNEYGYHAVINSGETEITITVTRN